ncbi:phage tail protein [Francisella sp. SYW-9]|uniref:phage tail protein n=1 Tax=Francisella sp. SYW-9 TaxID=2610888 RepID=UPI001CD0B95B|nr:phage tail protein [Francisella sp. SYW-9]
MLKKQKGNAVIGALLLIVILSFIVVIYYKHLHYTKLQESASRLGLQISMVVDGLEKRLSFDQSFNAGHYTITDLINRNCGGRADDDYLPCGFTLDKGLSDGGLAITVTNSATNPDVRLASITTDPIGIYNTQTGHYQPISYLAGAVLASAETTKAFSGGQYLSASVKYSLDTRHSTVTANVVANQNNSNIYLRVDGSNKMLNALQFNSKLNADHRMIKYLSKITNDGQNIFIGNQSGVKGNSNVVVNDLTIHSMGDKKLSSLLNSMPVGSVVAYVGATVPDGFFECNGAVFDTSKYPDLYKALGSSKLPDLRGQFIRGWDHGKGVDPGRVLGSSQGDAIRNISGSFTSSNGAVGGFGGANAGPFSPAGGSTGSTYVNGQVAYPSYTRMYFNAARVVPTAKEDRPKNIALMYIIKHD